MRGARSRAALLLLAAAVPGARSAAQVDTKPERTIRIAGFGALTGPVSSFGRNARAALRAAADSINRAGGIRLADGAVGRFEVTYADDRCRAGDAIALLRAAADSSEALAAVGPSCSAVAESLYRVLPPRLAVFTDGAMKAGLARISPWAFRNTPDERAMYHALWAGVRRRTPALRTVFGGEEGDFAHSHATWTNIIGPEADAAGFTRVGAAAWSIGDTTFAEPVTRMREAGADVVVLSAHAATTCGVLAEMRRQGVRPKLIVGLTSAATDATLARCDGLAEGILIPTSFAPVTPAARGAAAAVERAGGTADLHSMAAWEILFALKRVIEGSTVRAVPATLEADRRALRDGLAALGTMDGLLGPIARTPERESRKPFVLVRARRGGWDVVPAK